MIVSDNTIQAEGLGDFFKILGKVSTKAAKKLARIALKNLSQFLEIGAKVATAAVSRTPKAALSTFPEVIKFYHTSKGLYLLYLILYKSTNKIYKYTYKSNFYYITGIKK